MDKQIAGNVVSVNEEGYLVDPSQWTREIATEIAREEGIELSERHWKVIEFLRQSHEQGQPLSIRAIGKRGPVSIKEFYELFPDGPLKKAAKIAGIPKPASCV